MKNNEIYFMKNGFNGKIKVAKNQKVIQVHRIQKGINFEACYKAMERLTSDAYVLFSYLIMHPLDSPWALSSKDVTSRTSLSRRTYDNAVHELIDKGYLVSGDINMGDYHRSENAYHLLEDPDKIVLATKRDKEN